MINWHASLVEHSLSKVLCTGVRLDDNWVTLKASCVEGRAIAKSRDKYRIAIGYLALDSTNRESKLRSINRVTIHPEYNRKNKRKYDIALIQLTPLRTQKGKYDDAPCIMSQPDLTKAINEFKIGTITSSPTEANAWLNRIDVSANKIKLAPVLCSSGQYVCSRFVNINKTTHNIDNAPIYVRYGIRDIDWGLAGLTTRKWRRTKSGRSVIHKHIPLYAYINWFDYVMGKEEKYFV